VASQGLVEAYVHLNGRVGSMVEVNCETDFVAKTDEFRALAHDIALHVTGASPQYLKREDVPADIVEKEREILESQAKNEGLTGDKLKKVTEDRLSKFFSEICLMEQPFIRDPGKTIGDIIGDTVARIGENVQIRRFVRYQLSEK
jgi:elongation factor Ts